MTLTDFQRKLINSASQGVEKLNNLMNPKTKPMKVIVTLEIDINVHIEEAEEDTGFKGEVKFGYDDNLVGRDIDRKIREQIDYLMTN